MVILSSVVSTAISALLRLTILAQLHVWLRQLTIIEPDASWVKYISSCYSQTTPAAADIGVRKFLNAPDSQ